MASSTDGARSWSAENLLVLLLLVALPVTFASGFTAYEVIKDGVLLGGGALLLLAWTLRAIQGQTLRLRGVLALLPLAALAVLAASSAVWAVNPSDALLASGRWLALLGVLLAVLDPLDRPLPFGHMAAALAGGIGAAGALGILQGFGVELDPLAPRVLADGLRGSFDNQRIAALTLASALPIAAAGCFTGGLPTRILSGVGLALGAFFLGMVNVTDAWFVLGGGAAISALLIAAGHGLRGLLPSVGALGALGAAGLIALAGVAAAPAPSAEPALPIGLSGTSLERGSLAVDDADWDRPELLRGELEREYAAATGLATFAAHPLGGVGAGNYDAGAMGWAAHDQPWYQGTNQSRPTLRSAHNSWIQLGAELGAFGVALLSLFLLAVLAALWQAMRQSARNTEDGQALPLLHLFGLVGTWAALLIASAREDMLGTATGALLLVATSGLVLRNAFALLDERGLARPWVLSREDGGPQAMERFVLSGLLPLGAAALALYLGGVALVSNYYQARGDVWLRHGSLDKSLEAYQAAVEVSPGNDLALFQLAQVAATRLDPNEAEQALVRALQARPYDPRLLTTLGALQARLAIKRGRDRLVAQNAQEKKSAGKPDLAGQGPGVDPSPLSAEILLSYLDQPTLTNAEANLNRALELHPRFNRALQSLGNLYLTQKNNDKALALFNRALEHEPAGLSRQRADLHVRIAQIYTTDAKWTLAREHTLKALEAYPEHPGRKTLLTDLEELDARISGKPSSKQDNGHAHGSGPGLNDLPVDVNKRREERVGEHAGHEGEHPTAPPASAAPPTSVAPPASAP